MKDKKPTTVTIQLGEHEEILLERLAEYFGRLSNRTAIAREAMLVGLVRLCADDKLSLLPFFPGDNTVIAACSAVPVKK